MKKRSFNFSTKINKLKRRLKYFAEIVSKKEKQMREANARKLNYSIDDINKFYTEAKDPSKQMMVFRGKIASPEDRKEIYNINTWLEKIKVDGQEKTSQEFVEFVQREQSLLDEYEEVFDSGTTPDGGGKLLDVISTPDNYNWEVWKVDSWEASRYLGGAFGDSVSKKNIGDNYTKHYEDKQISYRQHEARWCISYCKDGFWKNYYERDKNKFIFLIRQDFNEDKFGKVTIQIEESGELVFWDSEDGKETFESYEHFGFLMKKIKGKNLLKTKPLLNEEKIKIIDGIKTYEGDIKIKTNERFKEFAEYEIHTVIGNFDCSDINIVNLEGAPKEVGGYFHCLNNSNLKSLAGAPKKVVGDFVCNGCPSLTSLEGAPEVVGGCFGCSWCRNLVSLKGAPEIVGEYFGCSYCLKLTNLIGAPLEVGGDFYCNDNSNLETLIGAPQKVVGDFNCSSCPNLTSLVGAPQIVNGSLNCSWCKNLVVTDEDKEKYRIVK